MRQREGGGRKKKKGGNCGKELLAARICRCCRPGDWFPAMWVKAAVFVFVMRSFIPWFSAINFVWRRPNRSIEYCRVPGKSTELLVFVRHGMWGSQRLAGRSARSAGLGRRSGRAVKVEDPRSGRVVDPQRTNDSRRLYQRLPVGGPKRGPDGYEGIYRGTQFCAAGRGASTPPCPMVAAL